MATEDIVVVFGAKIRPDGTASGAMQRRVNAALNINDAVNPLFIVTGAARGNGPSEASVMQRMLETAGERTDRIVADEASKDTLDSVVACAREIRARSGSGRVFVCTDQYHLPRCRWLFRMLSIPSVAAKVESGRAANGTMRWLFWYVREIFATPWDTVLLLGRILVGRT